MTVDALERRSINLSGTSLRCVRETSVRFRHSLAALVFASYRAPPGNVPHDLRREQLCRLVDVATLVRLVPVPDDVLRGLHTHLQAARGSTSEASAISALKVSDSTRLRLEGEPSLSPSSANIARAAGLHALSPLATPARSESSARRRTAASKMRSNELGETVPFQRFAPRRNTTSR